MSRELHLVPRCENCGSSTLCEKCLGHSEPGLMVVLRESAARKLVAAAESGHAHQVIDILKQQAWWDDICAGVRGLRHLRPVGYVEEFGQAFG